MPFNLVKATPYTHTIDPVSGKRARCGGTWAILWTIGQKPREPTQALCTKCGYTYVLWISIEAKLYAEALKCLSIRTTKKMRKVAEQDAYIRAHTHIEPRKDKDE